MPADAPGFYERLDWEAMTSSDPTALPCVTLTNASLVPHVKALLDAAGILYFIKNETMQEVLGWGSGMFGFNPLAGAPVVMVEASRVDEARALLQDLVAKTKASPESGSARTPAACPRCRQALESDDGDAPLSHCYHCGWPL